MSPFDPFVGVPFVEGGREDTGCDCWGLVRLVYKACLEVDLPSLRDGYADHADQAAIAGLIDGHMGPWRPIAPGDERPFDAILIAFGGHPTHIAMVTRPGRMLHARAGAASSIENYRTFIYSNRIAGFFRHETQA